MVKPNFKQARYIYYLLLFLFILSACNKSLSYKDFIKYVNDPSNGLSHSKTINGLTCKTVYRPSEMLVWQELGGEKVDKNIIEGLQNKYNQQLYFKLSYSYNSKDLLSQATSKKVFGGLVQTLSFSMHNYVSLITNTKDTLQLIDCHYLRLYELANNTEMLLVFDKEKIKNKKVEWLRLDLDDLGFGIGQLSYKFSTNSINKIPELKYTESKKQ